MHKLKRGWSLAAVTALTIGLAAADAASTPRKITVTAKKFEWSPAKIELKVGETIELILESADVKHGFSRKDPGIQKVKFKKGEPATVTFAPDKLGTYRFKCTHVCGTGHRRIKGEIVVVP